MAQYKVSLWDTTRDAPLPLITELAAASDWLGYWQRLCYFSCSSYSIFFWDSSWIPSKASLRLHLLLYSIRRLPCILTKALLILLLLFLMRSFIWDSPWVLFRVLLLLLFLLFLRRKLVLSSCSLPPECLLLWILAKPLQLLLLLLFSFLSYKVLFGFFLRLHWDYYTRYFLTASFPPY